MLAAEDPAEERGPPGVDAASPMMVRRRPVTCDPAPQSDLGGRPELEMFDIPFPFITSAPKHFDDILTR